MTLAEPDLLDMLTEAERTTPHRSVKFEAMLAAIETVAAKDGTVDAARVRAFIEANVPELVHYNSGVVYRWLLKTGRAVIVDWVPLNNVEHRANRPTPVYRMVTP